MAKDPLSIPKIRTSKGRKCIMFSITTAPKVSFGSDI